MKSRAGVARSDRPRAAEASGEARTAALEKAGMLSFDLYLVTAIRRWPHCTNDGSPVPNHRPPMLTKLRHPRLNLLRQQFAQSARTIASILPPKETHQLNAGRRERQFVT
jgi:hypothetical protein